MNNRMGVVLAIVLTVVSGHASAKSRAWQTTTAERAGFDQNRFNDFTKFVLNRKDYHYTDSLLIVKDGKIVFEKYANGYKQHQKHIMWSITKTLLGSWIGVAEKQGYLSRNDLVSRYVRVPKGPAQKLQIKNLLRMSSGIQWRENAKPGKNDTIKSLFTFKFYINLLSYSFKKAFQFIPGTNFNYSSGDSAILSSVLRAAINNEATYQNYPWRAVFDPAGMGQMTCERDGSGTFIGSAYCWGTARNLAAFGQMYLDNGRVSGRQVIPADWVKFSKTLAPSLNSKKNRPTSNKKKIDRYYSSYGGSWWLNRKLPGRDRSNFPSIGEDSFFAFGFRGQTLAVIPQHKIVLVRFADDSRADEILDRGKIFSMLVGALKRGQK